MMERTPRPKSKRHEDLLKSKNNPNHIPETFSLKEVKKQSQEKDQKRQWVNDGTTVSESSRILNRDDETGESTIDYRRPTADFYEDSTANPKLEELVNVLKKNHGFERLKAASNEKRLTKERIASIRARLDEIEEAVSNPIGRIKQSYDSEVEELENELRALQKAAPMPKDYWKRGASAESATPQEQKEKLGSIISEIVQYESPSIYLPDLSNNSVVYLQDLKDKAEMAPSTTDTNEPFVELPEVLPNPESPISPEPTRDPKIFTPDLAPLEVVGNSNERENLPNWRDKFDELFKKTSGVEIVEPIFPKEPFTYDRPLTAAQKDTMAERAGLVSERTAMQDAESKYLAAYKNFYATNDALRRLGKSTIGSHEAQVLKSLEAKYKDARYAYSKKMSNSVEERLLKRESRGAEWGTGKRKELTPAQKEKIAERYQRLVHLNEIVKPAFEKRTQARAEALNTKGKSAFEKGIAFAANANKKFEDMVGGKKTAMAIRAFAVAGVLTVGVAATGAFAASGVMGLAGFGAYKLTRSAVGIVAGTGVGIVTEKEGRKRSLLRQKQSKKELENLKARKVFSKKSLESLDEAYEKHSIRSKDETVEKDAALAKAIGAFIGGAGVTLSAGALFEAYNHFDHLAHAAHAATEHAKVPHGAGVHPSNEQVPKHAVPNSNTPEHPSANARTPDTHQSPSASGSTEAPAQPAKILEHAAITGKGEGMGKMFEELRHNISSSHIDPDKMTPVMKHFMSGNINEQLRHMGALTGKAGDVRSMTMHAGDQAYFDDHQNLWFKPNGKAAELVMENNPKASDGITFHELHHHMSPERHVAPHNSAEQQPAPTEHADATTPQTPETPKPEDSAQANAAAKAAADKVPTADLRPENLGRHPYHSNPQDGGAEQAPNQTPASAPIEQAPSAPAPESIITNNNGVQINPTEYHLYGAVNAATHREDLVFYGDPSNEKVFAQHLAAFAREHRGRAILFNTSGILPGDNKMHEYVASAWANLKGVVTINPVPVPGSIDSQLNIQSFNRIIE